MTAMHNEYNDRENQESDRLCPACDSPLKKAEKIRKPSRSCLCIHCEYLIEKLYNPLFCLLQKNSGGKTTDELPTFVIGLYEYQEPLRSLILNAKVKNHSEALKSCVDLFMRGWERLPNQSNLKAITPIHPHEIYPMPSSLWGRLRGRWDLAWHLAKSLSAETSTPIHRVSWKEYFHIKKRSLIDFKERSSEICLKPSHSQNIPYEVSDGIQYDILVDDVVTTGSSIKRAVQRLEEDSSGTETTLNRTLCLTLGYSPKLVRHTQTCHPTFTVPVSGDNLSPA